MERKQKKEQLESQIIAIGKYLFAIAAPLTCILLLSFVYLLVDANNNYTRDLKIKNSLERSNAIYGLITRLQVERGLTCVYLTARM